MRIILLRALLCVVVVLLTVPVIADDKGPSKATDDSPLKIEVRGTLKRSFGHYFLRMDPKPKHFKCLSDIQIRFGRDKKLLKEAGELDGKTVIVIGAVVETVPSRSFPVDWELIIVVEPKSLKAVETQ